MELLVGVAVLGVIITVGAPPLRQWLAQLRVRLAASEITAVLRHTRARAIESNRYVAVKFHVATDGTVSYGVHYDGDGDGVRNTDIEQGTDPLLEFPRRLERLGAEVRFGFPPGPAPRDPGDEGRRLDRLEDPVRFNRSDLASFSPIGESTPGTVYITDGWRHLAAVRLFGRTGKVKVLWYDRKSESWEIR